jgi:hypothetical protein
MKRWQRLRKPGRVIAEAGYATGKAILRAFAGSRQGIDMRYRLMKSAKKRRYRQTPRQYGSLAIF